MRRLPLSLLAIGLHLLLGGHALGQRLYLSGTGSEDTRQWDFYCSGGQHSGRWSKIAVPSCWELQGYGAYTYGRFYKTPGLKASDETGRYRTRFSVPKDWAGKYVRLTFEGVMTDAEVWIDGQKIGPTHQGGFTEFCYDVTSYVTPGKRHQLEVLVSKESANASVNSAERRADWWLFGGIYRPVYLEAMPMEHIEHLAIDARANGDLYVNQTGLELTLDGRNIPWDPAAGCYHCGEVSTWDPEHPNLHTATFTLPSSGHSLTQKIGFRTIEFRPHDGIYLNGTRLVVKGTNRHCFHPESGRTTSRELSLQDARLIKQMNMNAVRCHYPSDRHFLEACDSIGLLYIDEFPGWQTRYDDTTAVRMLPEFVMRDVNHPCVFLWSNGNEGGWNTTVDPLFAQYDPQRRKVIHPWSDFEGLDTHHYPAYQTGAYRMHQGQNVFMPTEFLHGKYDKGQGAALEDMWKHWMESPLFAGGFIWAYVDEAVRRTDLGGLLDSDGGNGPDGVMDPYRQPEGSFYTIREVWSPIQIDKLNVPPHFDGRISVENRWLFTHLDECSMSYRVTSAQGTLIEEGPVALPHLAPSERGWARMPVSERFAQGDILEVKAYDREQQEICCWTAPIHRAEEQNIDTPSDTRLEVRFADNGVIEQIVADGRDIPLHGGPLPVGMLAECYRQQHRTEANGDQVTTFWYRGGIDSIQWRQTADGRLLMDAVVLNDDRGHGYKGSFLPQESGWQIGLTFDYPEERFAQDKKKVTWLGRGPYRVWRNRQKGQQFGLWEKEYNNTVTGQYNTLTPPVYPEFKGYHADVRWMEFPDFKVTSLTEALFVRLYTPEEAVDQTAGEMFGAAAEALDASAKDADTKAAASAKKQDSPAPKKQERTMIPFPAGDVSFLLSIPPMQSYKPLEQLGPSAQPDNIRIKPGDEGFHIRLLFEFGK